MDDPDRHARFARRARGDGLSARSPRQRIVWGAIMALAVYGGFAFLRWVTRERDLFLDEPFGADTVVEIQRSCMNAGWSFGLELSRSGELRITPRFGDRDTRRLSPAELDAILDLFFRFRFQQLDESYVDARYTDAPRVRLSLNARGVRKRVVADASDPDAKDVFGLVKEINAQLGIDRYLESLERRHMETSGALRPTESR